MILDPWQGGGETTIVVRRRRRCKAAVLELAIGYWFCAVCEKPVELNLDGPANVCALCGSPRVRWKGGDQ